METDAKIHQILSPLDFSWRQQQIFFLYLSSLFPGESDHDGGGGELEACSSLYSLFLMAMLNLPALLDDPCFMTCWEGI